MLNCCVSYINLIAVESIFAIFYAVFPQAVLETPMPMRVQHTHALVKVPTRRLEPLGQPGKYHYWARIDSAFSGEEPHLPGACRHLRLRVSNRGWYYRISFSMHVPHGTILLFAALLAGAINSVAGGGSF